MEPAVANQSTDTPETEPAVPKYLFRAYGRDSHGRNERDCLAPAITLCNPPLPTTELHGLRFDASPDRIGKPKRQLKEALNRKLTVPHNPFVFFTSSFPQSIVHAMYKDHHNNPDVHITCLDTTTARTPSGDPVKFVRVRDTMILMELELTDGHVYEPLDFEDVWVTSDIVEPQAGSSVASLTDLMTMNLFRCVPELGAVFSHHPGVAAPIRNLRAYWSAEDTDLPAAELNWAAQLASTFKTILESDDKEYLPMHIFAWILTMKEQGPNLPGLLAWLVRRGVSLPDSNGQASAGASVIDPSDASKLCEVQRFNELYQVMCSWSVRIEDISSLPTSISNAKVRERREGFKAKRGEINGIRARKRQAKLKKKPASVDESGKPFSESARKKNGTKIPSDTRSTDAEPDTRLSIEADEAPNFEDETMTSVHALEEAQIGEDREPSTAPKPGIDQRIEDINYSHQLKEAGEEFIMNDTCDEDEDMEEV